MFACWLSGLCSSFSGEVLPGVCRSCRIFPVHGTSEPPWRPGDVYCCTFWRGFSTTSEWLFYHFKTAVGTVCRCQFFMSGCGHFGSGAAFPLVHMCLYMPVFVSPELSKKPACPLPGSLFCSGSFLCHPLETLERVNCAIFHVFLWGCWPVPAPVGGHRAAGTPHMSPVLAAFGQLEGSWSCSCL